MESNDDDSETGGRKKTSHKLSVPENGNVKLDRMKSKLTDDGEMIDVEDDGKDVDVPISYIDPRTIKWVNKRRHNAVSHTMNTMSSQRLKQLKEIFNSFEVDGEGSLHFEKFKRASEYLDSIETPASTTDIEQQRSDRKVLKDIFYAYDTDKDGLINFNDFVAGMTSETSDQKLLDKQQAFFEIATKHRRQKIIDRLCNDVIVDDINRYRNFNKLFSVKYFHSDQVEDTVLDGGHNIPKKSSLTRHQKHVRNNEVYRAREAAYALKSDALSLKRREKASFYANTQTAFVEPENAATSIFEHHEDEIVPHQEESKTHKKLSKYAMHKTTFVPHSHEPVRKALQLKLKATQDAGAVLRCALTLPPLR